MYISISILFLGEIALVFELKITPVHIHTFRLIIEAYQHCTPIPAVDEWKNYSNNQLWLRLVGQVMVAGGSRSKAVFDRRSDLQQAVRFSLLEKFASHKVEKTLHHVLMQAGVRFVGKDILKSHKTSALTANFKFISDYPGKLKGLMQYLASISGGDAEMERVRFLSSNLKYVKNKSARDFLMGCGMNRNTLAIDVRLRNIFNLININFPGPEELAKGNIYSAVENELITKVCTPLCIEPVALDRIMYINYINIMKRQYLQRSLFRSKM